VGAKISARPRLQRHDVVDRAMQMADAEGLDTVTIRRLAQELGVTPMALYWHFSDKDSLLAAISERLWDEVAAHVAPDQPADPEAADAADAAGAPGAVAGRDDWAELHTITAALVGVLRQHPGCAPLAPLAVLTCESGLDITERTLGILAAKGMQGERAAELAHFLLSTAVTLASTRPGGDLSADDADDAEDRLRAKRVALASLPPARYPNVAAMAGDLVECADVEGYFARGIDFVLGGLRQQVLDGAPASVGAVGAVSAARAAGAGRARATARR
jgi:TetR/AcrR family tetracycline transcriptional repressor